MVVTKDTPEYVPPDPGFTPGPKNSHHKAIDDDFAALKAATDAGMDKLWEPSMPLDAFRQLWLGNSPGPPGCPEEGEDVVTATQEIPVRDGASIEVKTYAAKDKRDGSALVVRFHGGGWVLGGHNTEHPESLMLAARTNSVVVSVAYRMAPEYKFPYAVNDCFDGLKWAKDNAASLGADPDKIILNGGSAGGNLASVVALMARDEGVPGVVGQVLTFPVTCHPKFFPTDRYELASYRQCADASIVSPVRMEWFLDQYMPEPTPDWRFSSLLAPSLKGLPPALVLVSGFDILRDEAIAYAERMQSEGVDVDLHVYQGMPHTLYAFPTHPKTIDYYGRIVDFVKKYSG